MEKRTEQGKARKNEYIKKYKREYIKNITLGFNTQIDADVIDYLSKVGNKATYIKELVRADIKAKAQ